MCPMGLVHGLLFKNLLSDIYGSRVASVVVLALSLAFPVASELGAIAGWYCYFRWVYCGACWRNLR